MVKYLSFHNPSFALILFDVKWQGRSASHPGFEWWKIDSTIWHVFSSQSSMVLRERIMFNFLITKDEEYNSLHALKVITTKPIFLGI